MACIECGAPLWPEKPVTRTICNGRIRVTLPEATCTGCGEAEQVWPGRIRQFFDRAHDLLDARFRKPGGPELEAAFDDQAGWVFAPV